MRDVLATGIAEVFVGGIIPNEEGNYRRSNFWDRERAGGDSFKRKRQ
jgi:hypothetical protein